MSTPGWGPPAPGQDGFQPGWGQPPPGVGAAPTHPACFRHPDRSTGLRCTRCGRAACPECLRDAAVGFQCVTCVADGQREVRSATSVVGARLTPGPPVVTFALIGVNVAMYLLTAVLARSALDNGASALFQRLALFPYGVAEGELPRLVVSGFLHFGPLHLLVNMYALYILGRDLESVLGRVRYGAVYAVSLLSGSTAVMLFQTPNSLTAGASGAVFGLMGGLAVVLYRLKRSPTPVLTVIALNVAISVAVPNISLWGHLGGLVAGGLATAVLVYAPAPRRTQAQVIGLLVLTALLLVLVVVRVLALQASLGR